MRAHLLPSRSTLWKPYKCLLAGDAVFQHRQIKGDLSRIDLFTDGSCLMPTTPSLALGSWEVHRLLLDPEDIPEDDGEGLWVEIQSPVRHRSGSVVVQHVAAHRASWAELDPVDEWTALWNDRADREAGAAQLLRGTEFMELRDRLPADVQHTGKQLAALQKLHLEISTVRLETADVDEDGGDEEGALRDWCSSRQLHADGSWIGAGIASGY